MMLKRRMPLLLPFSLLVILLVSACGGSPASGSNGGSSSPGVVSVVAAENFYGNVIQQLGGSHVSVKSIISDPNVDPHEYESNVQDGIAIQKAQLVVENGLGYDSWLDKLLSASPNPSRIVLVAGNIANHKLPDNPHVWYGIDNMPAIAQAITDALKKLDSKDSATFDSNLATFEQSLGPIQTKINEINAKYKGTKVALTETIYLYQSIPEGLDVLTPFEFDKAIAEGNDPPADTVVEANNEITMKEAKILIYNVQTITPITTNLQNEAKSRGIPIVPVSETMPPGKTYQSWMLDQLNMLEQALAQTTGH
jgi:zinc/manganese transport system substrate-binding protein